MRLSFPRSAWERTVGTLRVPAVFMAGMAVQLPSQRILPFQRKPNTRPSDAERRNGCVPTRSVGTRTNYGRWRLIRAFSTLRVRAAKSLKCCRVASSS